MNKTIEIARAGLNRFYDEGYVRWPEDKLMTVFGNCSLQDSQIVKKLENWEKASMIELPKKKEEYLIMLKIIPDEA